MKRIARWMILAGLGALASTARTQETTSPVLVRKLTLTATDKPNADWRPIAASLEGRAYTLDDLVDRIQQKFRDDGYYLVHAEAPQVTDVHQEGASRSADISVQMEAGDQYTMGEVIFKNAPSMKKEQMRAAFPLVAGSVFNAGAVGTGIEKLKSIYEAQGFADVGAVPSMAVNEEKHTIDIYVEVEEGYPYLFGQLSLDGNEPVPGESKALLASWAQIAGKRYNPDLLKKWLAANTPKSAPGASPIHSHAEGIADTEAHLMNVRLHYQ